MTAARLREILNSLTFQLSIIKNSFVLTQFKKNLFRLLYNPTDGVRNKTTAQHFQPHIITFIDLYLYIHLRLVSFYRNESGQHQQELLGQRGYPAAVTFDI